VWVGGQMKGGMCPLSSGQGARALAGTKPITWAAFLPTESRHLWRSCCSFPWPTPGLNGGGWSTDPPARPPHPPRQAFMYTKPEYLTMASTFRTIYKEGGLSVFFHGLIPRTTRIIGACGSPPHRALVQPSYANISASCPEHLYPSLGLQGVKGGCQTTGHHQTMERPPACPHPQRPHSSSISSGQTSSTRCEWMGLRLEERACHSASGRMLQGWGLLARLAAPMVVPHAAHSLVPCLPSAGKSGEKTERGLDQRERTLLLCSGLAWHTEKFGRMCRLERTVWCTAGGRCSGAGPAVGVGIQRAVPGCIKGGGARGVLVARVE